LTTRAEKCAARRLHDAADGRTAMKTGRSRPVINPEPFSVEIRGARRAAKIKQTGRFI